jgi:hypothetical protein
MKIYIAGASSEIETAMHWIAECKKIGIEITHDWTFDVLASKLPANSEKYSLPEKLRQCAQSDYDGVIHADVFWALSTEGLSRGLHTEAGVALKRGGNITVVSGPDWQRNIFFYLFKYQCSSHEVAFDMIKRMHEKGRGT